MKQYNIYIGLSNSVTRRQMFSTEKYAAILKKVCKCYRVRFSFSVVQGGYLSDDGEIVDETTLQLSLLDLPEMTVNEIAEDLCTFFNQDSVMITEGELKMYYLNGNRNVQETMSSLLRKEADIGSETQ